MIDVVLCALLQESEDLRSTQQLGVLHNRQPGSRVHICLPCGNPINVYGKLYPCLHTFCLVCSTDMDCCTICHASIFRLERVTAEQGMFISPTTLQGFKTEDELREHTRLAHQHLMKHPAVQAALSKTAL